MDQARWGIVCVCVCVCAYACVCARILTMTIIYSIERTHLDNHRYVVMFVSRIFMNFTMNFNPHCLSNASMRVYVNIV